MTALFRLIYGTVKCSGMLLLLFSVVCNWGQAHQWPELSTQEHEILHPIVSKALQGAPLSNADILAYRAVVADYTVKSGKRQPATQVKLFRVFFAMRYQYQREFGTCLLASLNTKKPILTAQFIKLGHEMKRLGYSKEKLESDYLRIASVASASKYTDSSGQSYYPPTRAQIIDGLRRNEVVKTNFERLAAVYEEFSE